MTRSDFRSNARLAAALTLAAVFFLNPTAQADPSKYPQFAQQSLPEKIKPSFISVDELVEEIKAGKKPLIVDVRSDEEFREAHILGAFSAPLGDFDAHLKSIPTDRLVVLY